MRRPASPSGARACGPRPWPWRGPRGYVRRSGPARPQRTARTATWAGLMKTSPSPSWRLNCTRFIGLPPVRRACRLRLRLRGSRAGCGSGARGTLPVHDDPGERRKGEGLVTIDVAPLDLPGVAGGAESLADGSGRGATAGSGPVQFALAILLAGHPPPANRASSTRGNRIATRAARGRSASICRAQVRAPSWPSRLRAICACGSCLPSTLPSTPKHSRSCLTDPPHSNRRSQPCRFPGASLPLGRGRERPILFHRHLVAAHRQTAPRHHHHLRTLRAVPEHLSSPPTRITGRRRSGGRRICAGDPRAGDWRTSAPDTRPGGRWRTRRLA